MADREKVIKSIEICYILGHDCTECPLFTEDDCNDKLMRDAVTLLKEQEPIKPLITGHGDFETVGTWWHECGNCRTQIDPADKYCRKCGKAVWWDLKEDDDAEKDL